MVDDSDLRTILRSRQFQADWYRSRYPDVDQSGLDPALHYLRYGGLLQRQPGSGFDAKFYCAQYPEVVAQGANPLLHFLRRGRKAGYLAVPPQAEAARRRLGAVRARMLTEADVSPVVEELVALASTPSIAQVEAGRDLAMWLLGAGRFDECYHWATTTLAFDAPLRVKRRLVTIAISALVNLGERERAFALCEKAALDGQLAADAYLVLSNLADSAEGRLAWINQALGRSGLSPMTLLPDDGQPIYDRLDAKAPPPVTDGPLVTVLLAAYESADLLPTALRALEAQSWRNLEVIVLDDCSPSSATMEVASAFAARDLRFRAVRLEQNGGAYIARNHGLDLARGEFITLHDADDWSHPVKIETQMRHMLAHPDTMGCTSQQARCSEDLGFHRLRGTGNFIVANTSSFLWRRDPVHKAIGYWDTVRFGADNEFIRRMQKIFGSDSYQALDTGPLSFQREAQTSITRDPVKGLHPSGGYYGVRRSYHLLQIHHHRTAETLHYDNDRHARPFAVPRMMYQTGEDAYSWHADLGILADFSAHGAHLAEVLALIDSAHAAGERVVLIEATGQDGVLLTPASAVLERLRNGVCHLAVYGERVLIDRFEKFAQASFLRFAPYVALSDAPDDSLMPREQESR